MHGCLAVALKEQRGVSRVKFPQNTLSRLQCPGRTPAAWIAYQMV
jgi:hypothetical protein